ncbi:hypothetical protein HDU92_008680 [Lobulomyces angularis]|nr:hypothetical protein HDU92_008680 [Lobulomyces angularis]
MNSDEFTEYIKNELLNLQITDETVADYISSIALEESIEKEEKLEAITEFLNEATNVSVNNFVNDLMNKSKLVLNFNELEQEKKKNLELQIAKDFEEKVLKENSDQKLNNNNILIDKEEKKKRELLLAKYAYDLDELEENSEGEMEIVGKGKKEGDKIQINKNNNKDFVKEIEKLKRVKAKELHEKEVLKNKELLEKQRLEKEKKKIGTQKREKRRM